MKELLKEFKNAPSRELFLDFIGHVAWKEMSSCENILAVKTRLIFGYNTFLKTPLSLSMLIPTDIEGNVLQEPDKFKDWLENPINNGHFPLGVNCEQYQKAKESVLFSGFEVKDNYEAEIKFTNGHVWEKLSPEMTPTIVNKLLLGGRYKDRQDIYVGAETISDLIGQPINQTFFNEII